MSNLVSSWQSPLFRRAMLEAVLVGVLAGVVGVHVSLRRLPFFVTAMSHATFPGVVLASVLGFSLFVGGAVFGLAVVAVILVFGARRVLDDTAVIGVVLAGSFALGVLILSTKASSSKDLSAFLVGSVLTVTTADVLTTVAVGVAVVGVLTLTHKELVLGAFDRTQAQSLGYSTTLLDGLVLVVVTVTLVTAIPAVGTLLAIALLTVPAITARLWAERLSTTMVLSAAIGGASGALGLCAAAVWSIAAGGAIALAAGGFFVVSLLMVTLGRRLARAGGRPGAARPDAAQVVG